MNEYKKPVRTAPATLRERFHQELELRGRSDNTIRSYLESVQRLADYYDCSPAKLTREQIRQYLLYLIKERGLAESSVNLAHAAITCFFEIVLGRRNFPDLPHQKRVRPVPLVMSVQEVVKLLNAADSLKHKVMMMTMYSSGLRVSELIFLKVGDIDGDRKQIHVVRSKGQKDRYTVLSDLNRKFLREYFRVYRPTDWLFYGRNGRHTQMNRRSVWFIFDKLRMAAGIFKAVSPHSLRHSFATHSLEGGTPLPELQRLLGHSNPMTTHIYLHVQKNDLHEVKSPMDSIEFQAPDEPRRKSKSVRNPGAGGDIQGQKRLPPAQRKAPVPGPKKGVPGNLSVSDGGARRASGKVRPLRTRKSRL